jgi:hypothetical protein
VPGDRPPPSDAAPNLAPPAIAPGARLVHIGFYKSGTTALQSRATRSPALLAQHGVTWPLEANDQRLAAYAVAGRTPGWRGADAPAPPITAWTDLIGAVRAAPAGNRVLISSEFLADVRPEVIDRIVADLGGAQQVHVLATIRPLARVLPSAWQQNLKNGLPQPYDRWLRNVLASGAREGQGGFWSRHDYPVILQRWAEAVGPERVTVVITDSRRPELLFDSVTALLGLPTGLLAPDAEGKSNRSLSPAEAELLRRVNRALRDADYVWDDYRDLVRYGLVERMVERAAPPDAGIPLPSWAHQPVEEIASSLAAGMAALGVGVVGDLDQLRSLPAAAEDLPVPEEVPLDSAVQALLGALSRAVSSTIDLDPALRRQPPTPHVLRRIARRVLRRS